jgi:HD-GYP domain-containing protein (c-di-GMP phosphodiesterase class II)
MQGSKLLPIEARAISPGPINFTIYCSDSSRGMVLFARESLVLTDQHIAMLSNSARTFYIRESDSGQFLDYSMENLNGIMTDETIPKDVKTRMVHYAGKSAAQSLVSDPDSDEGYERIVAVTDHQISILSEGPEAALELFELTVKDEYAFSHTVNVAALNVLLGRELFGDNVNLIRELGQAGSLHDVGKTACDPFLLEKKGRLSPEEFEEIKLHASHSNRILSARNCSPIITAAAKHHHEKMDGSGYPDGLVGTDIPLSARITAVSDVYDALTSERAYSGSVSHMDALSIMSAAENHFDGKILNALYQVVLRNTNLAKAIKSSSIIPIL